ncbi:MAG: phage major tail tube protein [Synergistaceae bacterium]|nr:phage major tail tube protein [Synergistaceae bacterium]
MPNLIPEKFINFAVYIDGFDESGIADGTLPSLEAMTSEVKGAGIAGVVDSLVLGHFNSTTLSLKWRATPSNFYVLANEITHMIDIYGAIQQYDAGSGTMRAVPLHIFCRAITKKNTLGNLVVGDSQESETEHEVYFIKIELDHIERLMLDKFNYIYRVNGVDYLAEVRRALGK